MFIHLLEKFQIEGKNIKFMHSDNKVENTNL